MPVFLILLAGIGTILIGYYFGAWWALGLFAAYFGVGIISIILRSRHPQR